MGAEDVKILDVPISGMWVTGDLSVAPDGHSPMVKNIVTRPGGEHYVREIFRHVGPPPIEGVRQYYPYGFIEDWPRAGVRGAVYWETNIQTRITGYAWVYTQNAITKEYGWTKVAMPSNEILIAVDGQEYLGMMCFSALREAQGVASSIDAIKLTGSTLNVPEYVQHVLADGTDIYGRCLAVFGNRLIIANIQRQITNLIGESNGTEAMFGATPPWVDTNCNYTHNTLKGSYLIQPTVSTGVNASRHELDNVANVDEEHNSFFVTADLLNTDPTNEMPMTIESYVSSPGVQRNTAVNLGYVAIASAGSYYSLNLCIVAGTTAAAAPSYNVPVGSTIVDGTATFKNMGPNTIGKFEVTLPAAASANAAWQQAAFSVTYNPPPGEVCTIGIRYIFGNSTKTTWPLSPVQIGLKDGKSYGDPTKANKGIQVTSGLLSAPFIQREDGYTEVQPDTDDTYWWTEPDSFEIMSLNFAKLSQIPGEITAVCCPVAGRMIIYKQSMATVFQLGTDVNLPFIEERTLIEYGCANSRAWDVFEDTVYTVSPIQSEVFAFDGSGMPQPLCGDGMREAVFGKTGTAVAFGEQRIGIDREKREVHVYTQRDKAFVYNLDTKMWTIRTLSIQGVEEMQVGDFAWAYDRFTMVSYPSGLLVRESSEIIGADSDSTGASNNIPLEYWLPMLAGPGELWALIEKFLFHYRSKVDCDFIVDLSRDGGVTWTEILHGVIPPAPGIRTDYVEIPLWVSGSQPWVRIRRMGKGGRDSFRMVGLKAHIQIMGETIPPFTAKFGG
jgi:hypothetical protein